MIPYSQVKSYVDSQAEAVEKPERKNGLFLLVTDMGMTVWIEVSFKGGYTEMQLPGQLQML